MVVQKTIHVDENTTFEELKEGDQVILYFKPLEEYDWSDPEEPWPILTFSEIPFILKGSARCTIEQVTANGNLETDTHDDVWLRSQLTRVDILAPAEETKADDGYPTGPGWWWAEDPDSREWHPAEVVRIDSGRKLGWMERGIAQPIYSRAWGGPCIRRTPGEDTVSWWRARRELGRVLGLEKDTLWTTCIDEVKQLRAKAEQADEDEPESAEDPDTFDLYDVNGECAWSFFYNRNANTIEAATGTVISQDSLTRLAMLLGIIGDEEIEITRIAIGARAWSVFRESFERIVMWSEDAFVFASSAVEAFVRWALDRTGQPTEEKPSDDQPESESETPQAETFNLCVANGLRMWSFTYTPNDNTIALSSKGPINRSSLLNLAAFLWMDDYLPQGFTADGHRRSTSIITGSRGWYVSIHRGSSRHEVEMWSNGESRVFARSDVEGFVRWAFDRIGREVTFNADGKRKLVGDVVETINRDRLYVGENVVATSEVPSTHAETIAAIRGPHAPTTGEKVLDALVDLVKPYTKSSTSDEAGILAQVVEVIKRYDRPEASFDLMGEGEGCVIKLWSRWLPPVDFFRLTPLENGRVEITSPRDRAGGWRWCEPSEVPGELDSWLGSLVIQRQIDRYVELVEGNRRLRHLGKSNTPPPVLADSVAGELRRHELRAEVAQMSEDEVRAELSKNGLSYDDVAEDGLKFIECHSQVLSAELFDRLVEVLKHYDRDEVSMQLVCEGDGKYRVLACSRVLPSIELMTLTALGDDRVRLPAGQECESRQIQRIVVVWMESCATQHRIDEYVKRVRRASLSPDREYPLDIIDEVLVDYPEIVMDVGEYAYLRVRNTRPSRDVCWVSLDKYSTTVHTVAPRPAREPREDDVVCFDALRDVLIKRIEEVLSEGPPPPPSAPRDPRAIDGRRVVPMSAASETSMFARERSWVVSGEDVVGDGERATGIGIAPLPVIEQVAQRVSCPGLTLRIEKLASDSAATRTLTLDEKHPTYTNVRYVGTVHTTAGEYPAKLSLDGNYWTESTAEEWETTCAEKLAEVIERYAQGVSHESVICPEIVIIDTDRGGHGFGHHTHDGAEGIWTTDGERLSGLEELASALREQVKSDGELRVGGIVHPWKVYPDRVRVGCTLFSRAEAERFMAWAFPPPERESTGGESHRMARVCVRLGHYLDGTPGYVAYGFGRNGEHAGEDDVRYSEVLFCDELSQGETRDVWATVNLPEDAGDHEG